MTRIDKKLTRQGDRVGNIERILITGSSNTSLSTDSEMANATVTMLNTQQQDELMVLPCRTVEHLQYLNDKLEDSDTKAILVSKLPGFFMKCKGHYTIPCSLFVV